MKLTPDQVILRGIWARAVEEGGLLLPIMETAQAIRTRFLLFREAKAMRDEGQQGLIDAELLENMGMLTPRLQEVDSKHKRVSIESKGSMDIAELGRALGIESSSIPGQEKVVIGSLQRLNSLLEPNRFEAKAHSFSTPEKKDDAGKTLTAQNPYFTRGGE